HVHFCVLRSSILHKNALRKSCRCYWQYRYIMNRSFLMCVFCCLVLFSTQALSDAVDEAQVFVLRYDSQSEDLLRFSRGHIESTEEYQTIINSIGKEKADRLIFTSFLNVQYPYRLEWERSLAESYLEVFSI